MKEKFFLVNTTAPRKRLNQNKDRRACWVERGGTARMRSQLCGQNQLINTRGYQQIIKNRRVLTY